MSSKSYIKNKEKNKNKEKEKKKINPFDLLFIYNQTQEECLKRVKIDGRALKHVIKQTPEIVSAAVKQNPEAKEYMFGSCFLQKASKEQIEEFNKLTN